MTLPEWHEYVGVGFGPANIALAIAMEELLEEAPDVVFLEGRTEPLWQPAMMLEDSDVQNHPLRDLVTPRNPRSRYSFTNFLFEKGRLFEHLNLGLSHPMREEYAEYVAWVARHFDSQVRYGQRVASIEVVEDSRGIGVGFELRTACGRAYRARSVIVAPGRTPYVPDVLEPLLGDRVFHLMSYLPSIERVARPGMRIAVVGGSQSAVEIMLHLSDSLPDATVVGICRSFGYRSKDLGPFTGEVYFPEFVDRFHGASDEMKTRLVRDLHLTNYSAADLDVLDRLYRRIYHQKIRGQSRLSYMRVADLLGAKRTARGIELEVRHYESVDAERCEFDLVISATGFRDLGANPRQERCPPLLEKVYPYAEPARTGELFVERDYAIRLGERMHPDARCFLNGLCESSHGMGDAGSFSLLALRSERILRSLVAAPEATRTDVGSTREAVAIPGGIARSASSEINVFAARSESPW